MAFAWSAFSAKPGATSACFAGETFREGPVGFTVDWRGGSTWEHRPRVVTGPNSFECPAWSSRLLPRLQSAKHYHVSQTSFVQVAIPP